ncbi:uncharacterized protein LOC135398020 isoform X2 [Ornithodoros turicata]|uniref:uncharacterized protein LOC135398020 isoform X2 n=1 Tax=Ornithodoros turicata TaxID=34597 RepID=UPI003139D227
MKNMCPKWQCNTLPTRNMPPSKYPIPIAVANLESDVNEHKGQKRRDNNFSFRQRRKKNVRVAVGVTTALLVVATVFSVALYQVLGKSTEEGIPGGEEEAVRETTKDTSGAATETIITGLFTPGKNGSTARSTTPPTSMPRRPLLCTLGSHALLPQQYPPDGLCHLLFYTHVIFDNGHFAPVESPGSWRLFQQMAGASTATHYGISFDFGAIDNLQTALSGKAGQEDFAALFHGKIQHHGTLNVVGNKTYLQQAMSRLKTILPLVVGLHSLNTADSNKQSYIVIGVEMTNPLADGSYLSPTLHEAAKTFANILLVRTHVSSWDMKEDKGTAGASMWINSRGIGKHDLNSTLSAIQDLSRPPHQCIVMMSMTLAVASFHMGRSEHLIDRDTSSSKPMNFGLVDFNKACMSSVTETKVVEPEKIVLGADPQEQQQIIYESEDTMIAKVRLVHEKHQDRPSGILDVSWALFDVDYGDYSGACGRGTSFSRLEAVRREMDKISPAR